MKRAEAFTLRTYPYGEADRIVIFFTEETGILRGIAKGSLKLKSKISGALEPLTRVNLRYVEPHGRELVVVTGADAVSWLFDSITDLKIFSAAGLITELTLESHADRDPDPSHFRLLELVHQALKENVNPKLVMHYFELFTLKLTGVLPPLSDVKVKGAKALMKIMLRTNLLEIANVDPDHLQQFGAYLRRCIRRALSKNLNSYKFIDKIYSNTV